MYVFGCVLITGCSGFVGLFVLVCFVCLRVWDLLCGLDSRLLFAEVKLCLVN